MLKLTNDFNLRQHIKVLLAEQLTRRFVREARAKRRPRMGEFTPSQSNHGRKTTLPGHCAGHRELIESLRFFGRHEFEFEGFHKGRCRSKWVNLITCEIVFIYGPDSGAYQMPVAA